MANTTLNNKSTKKDIDQYINKLTDTITTTLDENVTTKNIKANQIGLPKLIRDMIKDKKYIRKKWQKIRIQYYKTQYNQHNKEIKRLIKIENNKNWQNKCNKLELTENINDTWKHLKQIMGTNHTKPTCPTLEITVNNVKTKIKTTQQKVETLTKSLEQTFTHDQDKKQFSKEHKLNINYHINSDDKIFKRLKVIPINYKSHPHNITKTEIAKTINKLNTKKAPGPGKINNKIIQLTIASLLDIIHNLYNICWLKGYHPNNWKIPKSILINKPNKTKKDPNNYRPIALINCLAKIMEKIINVRLTNYIEQNDIINKEQAGFRKNKSTHDKLFQLTQIAIQAKNRKQACASVFMDVEKAFDKVWHNGLLHTLQQHNIPVIFIRFISSFLSNRHTYFQIDNTFSNLIKINHGVPQGSSLSPTLFIIYAANLPQPPPTVHISQFADDIKTYSTSKDITQLQNKLQKSLNRKSRISLNENKTTELIITGRVHKYTKEYIPPLQIHKKPIPTTKHAKFLGVTFDQSLTFLKHINTTVAKAQSRVLKLHTIYNQHYGPSTMIRLYKIFIRPLLEYGHTATISATDNAIGIWENNQAQYIKKVLNLPNISKENIRKFGNISTIRTRINDIALRWYTNLYKNDNSPIIEFIDTQITDYHKMDKHDSPYRKITQLIAEQKISQNKAPESTME